MKLRLMMERRREEEGDLSRAERSVCYPGQEWVRGQVLGEGGFARVNLAYFPNPKTPKFQGMPSVAAVKSTRMSCAKELELEKEILDRFEDCPYIVRCLGDDVTYAEDDDDQLVLNVFLELASGGTLFDLVDASDGSGIPEPQAQGFTKSILGGLHRIHQEGLVHCDVKLENVLLVEEGNGFVAKVADLGLAHATEQSEAGRASGTKPYWAPEILTGGAQGQPSDVWALGCVVLAMLTGSLPWDDRGSLADEELMDLIAAESPVLPCGIYSDSAEDFLYKCFRKDPRKRPTTAMLLSHPFVSGAEDHQPLEAGTDGCSKCILIEDSSSEDGVVDDYRFQKPPMPLKKRLCVERPLGGLAILGC